MSDNKNEIYEKLDEIIVLLKELVNSTKEEDREELDLLGPIFYEVEDLEKILKLTKHTIRGFIHEGKLKAHKIGKNFRIYEEDLNEFLRNSTYDAESEGNEIGDEDSD